MVAGKGKMLRNTGEVGTPASSKVPTIRCENEPISCGEITESSESMALYDNSQCKKIVGDQCAGKINDRNAVIGTKNAIAIEDEMSEEDKVSLLGSVSASSTQAPIISPQRLSLVGSNKGKPSRLSNSHRKLVRNEQQNVGKTGDGDTVIGSKKSVAIEEEISEDENRMPLLGNTSASSLEASTILPQHLSQVSSDIQKPSRPIKAKRKSKCARNQKPKMGMTSNGNAVTGAQNLDVAVDMGKEISQEEDMVALLGSGSAGSSGAPSIVTPGLCNNVKYTGFCTPGSATQNLSKRLNDHKTMTTIKSDEVKSDDERSRTKMRDSLLNHDKEYAADVMIV